MRKFVTLDGLRGVAALFIAFRHLPLRVDPAVGSAAAASSYLAVDFFFVLSGFVIAHAYRDRLAAGLSLASFLRARLVRLYPLYFLAFVLSVPLSLAQFAQGKIDGGSLLIDGAFGLAMLPSPASAMLFPMNGLAWSLFFELVANALFAASQKWTVPSALVWIVAIAALAEIVTVSLGWIGFGAADGPMNAGLEWRSAGAGCLRVAYSFFAGALVHRIWRSRPPDLEISPFVLLAILAACLSRRPTSAYAGSLDLLTTLLVFPLLIYLGASCSLGKWSSAACGWLGAASYAIYILQAPFYGYALHAAPAILHEPTLGLSAASGFATFCVLIGIAGLADVYFDWPARRFLASRIASRSARETATPS